MISHETNPRRLQLLTEREATPCVLNLMSWTDAVKEIQTWPEYEAQPVRSLPATAKRLGIGHILLKDESMRFGADLASYKALGAPYALYMILAKEVRRQVGELPSSTELRGDKYRHITQKITVCVSTDGNQGRSLAYGARIFGCHCIIYINREVGAGRAQRIKDLGAIVIRVDGDHKASLERAKEDARMNDWQFVSSTSWTDFDGEVSQTIMNAYTLVVQEAIDAIEHVKDITHVFVCAGMGSISTRIFLHIYSHLQRTTPSPDKLDLPRFVVVEPTEADCLLQSVKTGSPEMAKGSLKTLMAGLACRSPSPAAWKVLSWLASDFIAVPDSIAVDGMKALANVQRNGDVPVVCGESSAATMGVLLAASEDATLRKNLGLDANSQVLLFGLEGATDPDMYHSLVGLTAEQVFESQKIHLSKHKTSRNA